METTTKIEKETWQNTSGSQVWIKTLDPRGNEKATHVRPGQKITITPLERQINNDIAQSDGTDVFKNGMLTTAGNWVQLIDPEVNEDVAKITNNPNAIAESEIPELFKLTAAKFKARIADIDSFVVIKRLCDVAEKEETKANLTQLRALEDRREALDTKPKTVRSDPNEALPEQRLS